MMTVTPVWQLNQMIQKPKLMAQFQGYLVALAGQTQADIRVTRQWSWLHPGDFWSAALGFCGLRGASGDTAYVHHDVLMQVQFFANAQLNVIEIFLRNAGDRDTIIFTGEDGRRVHWSRAILKCEVEKIAVFLRLAGFVKGGHVVGYMQNL